MNEELKKEKLKRERKMAKRKPKVCFLGTTYNGQVYIAETIQSILNQSLKEIEVIYINDGSTDNTVKITYLHSLIIFRHH